MALAMVDGTRIDGFSEAVLRFIAEFERTESSGDHPEG